jgi:LmbE family N-acetylglucosaminyl deacetylase
MFNNIHTALVVAAHPDDETLGCGGFLAKLSYGGVNICVLLLGEGPTSRSIIDNSSQIVKKESYSAARNAAAILGITDVRFASLPDNRFDTIPLLEITKSIEMIGEEIQPDLILTHFTGDLNIDHEITHRAVMTAFRPLPNTKPVSILSFEVLSSTEYASPEHGVHFQPNVYIDIADFLAKKKDALALYTSETRPWPHPRSREAVEHLARLRGSQCGREAAEAFILCRGVIQ